MLVTIKLTDEQLASLRVAEDQALYAEHKPVIKEPTDAVQYLSYIKNLPQEYVVVITVDSRNRVIDRHMISKGTLDASLVHPREVFRAAIVDNAAKIIIAHNHPSGNTEPSEDDIIITRRLVTSGKIVGITLMDHLIISAAGHYSLKQHGIV